MGVEYEILTPATVAAYINSNSELAGLVDTSSLEVAEVGDGNRNLVFLCRDKDGRGLCLKQSLPYLRLVGESWPLSPGRIICEARGLRAAGRVVPDLVPEVYALDRSRFIVVMENLDGYEIWRGRLNEGRVHAGVGAHLGRYVANVAFSTSLFAVGAEESKALTAESVNPDLCKITEDLVFTEPYVDHENNSFPESLSYEVATLRNDDQLVSQVGILKHQFMTHAEALIHGDLHTGSVMVRDVDGAGQCRVIDPEFCFYGPVGFDLGALFGNYLAARTRAAVLGRSAEFQSWLSGLVCETWRTFESEMLRLWPTRMDRTWTDALLTTWLAKIKADSVGYGGCKAIRRIIGLAKVSDIEILSPDQHRLASTIVLRTARRWILERAEVTHIGQLDALFEETAAEVLQQDGQGVSA